MGAQGPAAVLVQPGLRILRRPARRALLTLAALLLALLGQARAADVLLNATLSDNLQTVVGELTVAEGYRVVDALRLLPVPEDDLARRRTFPGPVEGGILNLRPTASGRWRFSAVLPRRYGASGLVPGRGLFMNGLWHPQPMGPDGVPVLSWDVTLTLPEGVLGVLNGEVGVGVLRWTGEAERLSLAALRQARVTRQPVKGGTLTLVENGLPRPKLASRLASVLAEVWPGPDPPRLTVVEAPLRRRLSRTAPGMLFLSDRALRLSDGLWRYHIGAARRGLLGAALPVRDPWARGFAAAAISEATPRPSPREILGWLSWIPPIDALLYDGNLPFYSDVFDEAHPVDPVRDDLLELLDPHGEPLGVVRRLVARDGAEAVAAMAAALVGAEGLPPAGLDEAARAAGLSAELVEAWRHPCPEQDLTLKVEPADGGWAVQVQRLAPVDAPEDAVPVRIDGETTLWETEAGPDSLTITRPLRPKSVALDPNGLVHQTSRAGDTWPARWSTTLSAWIYELDLKSGRIRGFADISGRRQYNTRWLFGAGLETNPEDLVNLSVYGIHYLGPLLDRRARPVRLGLALGPSLLDAHYRPTEQGALSLDAQAWLTWETRDDPDLPRRGHRVWLAASGGLIPAAGLPYGAASAGAVGLAPVGGRLVVAGRLQGALSDGVIAHRQLDLGGSGGLNGLSPGAALGTRKATGAVELRWQALRNASVPAAVAWLSDVQLTGGLEAGAVGGPDGLSQALGWTAGVATIWDVLGARPTLVGLWAGRPIVWAPEPLVEGRWPTALLRFDQPF